MYITNIRRLLTGSEKTQTFSLSNKTKNVMDRSKYTEKCLHILQIEQFTKLRDDPPKSAENKIHWELRKLKTRLTIKGITIYIPHAQTQIDFLALQNYTSFLIMAT